MIYFAAKHYKRFNPDAAIKTQLDGDQSPTYLTALAMWDDSEDQGGGGYFENDNMYI